MIGVERIARQDSEKYGVIAVDSNWSGRGAINAIIEKPKPADAPSEYAVAGRYILTSGIFDQLTQISAGRNGEIQLTDAIARLLTQEPVEAFAFRGQRFDCGSKLGYLEAIVTMGLNHPELGRSFEQFLREQISTVLTPHRVGILS